MLLDGKQIKWDALSWMVSHFCSVVQAAFTKASYFRKSGAPVSSHNEKMCRVVGLALLDCPSVSQDVKFRSISGVDA